MKNTFDFIVIKCPKCGHEYLPADVFYRDDLLGRPENIIRTENGTIELFTGENPNYEESFICDNCGCTFKVKASVNYSVEIDKEHDYSEDYETSLFNKERLILEESKLFEDD